LTFGSEKETLQFYSLFADSLRLAEVDGAAEWRRESLQAITDTIQTKLWISQNPKNCKRRRFVVCEMRDSCGFGCQRLKGLPKANSYTKLESDLRQFIQLDILDSSSYRPEFLPLSIPKSLSGELIMLHSNPSAFFTSQMVSAW
ncbi:hypothetical protein OSTOST_11834, partial [Ostertagia ostertagi]